MVASISTEFVDQTGGYSQLVLKPWEYGGRSAKVPVGANGGHKQGQGTESFHCPCNHKRDSFIGRYSAKSKVRNRIGAANQMSGDNNDVHRRDEVSVNHRHRPNYSTMGMAESAQLSGDSCGR